MQDETKALKTVFLCPSLNLRVEGLDNRPYAAGERITLKHQGRWLPMIVEEVLDDGQLRQVVLRLNQAIEPADLGRVTPSREPRPTASAGPAWIDGLVRAIEGGRGPARF